MLINCLYFCITDTQTERLKLLNCLLSVWFKMRAQFKYRRFYRIPHETRLSMLLKTFPNMWFADKRCEFKLLVDAIKNNLLLKACHSIALHRSCTIHAAEQKE